MNKVAEKILDHRIDRLNECILTKFGVQEKLRNVLGNNLSYPAWAVNDININELIIQDKGVFVECQELSDEEIDTKKPKFYRGYIYFDGEKYYIKRWRLKYINGVPFRSTGFMSEEFFIVGSTNYGDLLILNSTGLLFEEYEH